MLSHFSCVWLCDPIDYSLPGSSVYGILQARIQEWVTMPSFRGFFPTQEEVSGCPGGSAGRTLIDLVLYQPLHSRTEEKGGKATSGLCDLGHGANLWTPCVNRRGVCVLVTQSCLTLCNPTDCSLPGSSVHGISQARILEWVAISSSRGSSWPTLRATLYHLSK